MHTPSKRVDFLATLITLSISMTGTIKTLVADRKFGFIAREGETKDLFFHSKDLNGVAFDDLKVGDAVTFEVAQGEKGPNATGVSLVA